ncbi:MAG: hypothetical protein PF508_09675 [Spirochaeta sp.]|jgi:protein arginine kinase|nr:hypothetical protein [Spirochaeta sp.]
MIDHADTPRVSSWYSLTGPDREIVLASQVSLNRNLSDFPFQHLLSDTGVLGLRRAIDAALYALPQEFSLLDGATMTDEVRRFYEERGVLVSGDRPGVAAISPDHDLIVRLGTADHLRISAYCGGFDLNCPREKATDLDRALEEHLDYAVSLKLGYLSPDVKRVGTGLAATNLLHLPAIEHSDGLKLPEDGAGDRVVLNRYSRREHDGGSLYAAGYVGEFGESEDEIIGTLADFTGRLLHYEQEARQELLRRHGEELADSAGRALGTLRHARTLSEEESMDLLSVLRLGAQLGIVDDLGDTDVTELLFVAADSQVRILQTDDTTASVDTRRAALMRRLLGRIEDV